MRGNRIEFEAGLAALGGFSQSAVSAVSPPENGGRQSTREVNNNGAPYCPSSARVKTPKFSGKSDWEAFHAQFELLARAEGWSTDDKALQLAMCLTDDALPCLLLLSPEDRNRYEALVGALQRRFGQCLESGVLRNELSNRSRMPGESLRLLANDIESLTRRAYGHMPSEVQSELARDQFIRALSPADLRAQVQLHHPRTLQAAFEMAVEREMVWAGTAGSSQQGSSPAVRAAVGCPPGEVKPAWAAEITELLRAVSLQAARQPRPGPRACSPTSQSAPAQLPQVGEEGLLAVVREVWRKNCDGLDPQQQGQLWQLLRDFQDSFAMSEGEVGRTELVQHDIDTGDAPPIKCRPRRLPLARQEACDKAVWSMQQAGIIEPSDSPWAAAVVMVPKKNGDWRLCADYRPLNGVTRKDSYPLPRIDESLDLVSGSSWFSSLDLRSGYYQAQVKSFVGLASYYRRFVRGFSSVAAPLYQLLQKDRDFVWTEQCQEAFSSLQHALSEAPVLSPPDTTLPFILDTDASGVGAGGVLSQAQGVTCRELQMVDAAEWRRQQEQDTDLQPVLQWVEVQQRPLLDEVAVLSKATKGLWAAFESLRLCDCVLQRAWKEPATGEEKWQVVVPKGLKESVLKAMHGAAGSGHFGLQPLSPYPQQHASPHRGRGGPQVT
ncbi:hypothetical protein AAFF_G00358050 [Aldrovandia affinis]|uniref:Reverse transcriptase/retrotransposon-derived protein RNase H-like domain-containing protein n=1 Tax=Aldrovandia affinis TaxID=143900 RepID=A0AAD7X102_9TELE|nr:hypothetical protein AAFF_G00358050 [Aldrovandia affinis]